MYREPKGVFGKTIDSLLIKVNLFEGNTFYSVKIYNLKFIVGFQLKNQNKIQI